MPVLANAKHERFAQGVAKGMSADEAYAAAGYKPHRQNASRLMTNDAVRARVAELQTKVAEKVISAVSFDAVAMFTRLEEQIEKAAAAGDHKAAMDGRKFMLKAFGYEDHPTLTHEHVKQSKIEVGAPKAAAPEQPGGEAPPPANSNRFGEAMKRYAAAGKK